MSISKNLLTFLFLTFLMLKISAQSITDNSNNTNSTNTNINGNIPDNIPDKINDNINDTISSNSTESLNKTLSDSLYNTNSNKSSNTNTTNSTSNTTDDPIWAKIKKKQEAIEAILTSIINEVNNLTDRMNITLTMKEGFDAQIKNLTELTNALSERISLYNIEKKYAIDEMSHNLIEEIVSQMMGDLLEFKNQINQMKGRIEDENLKIEQFRDNLPDPNTVCSDMSNCTSCAANPSCGWCASSNICVEGNKEGPLQGQDTCQSYNFQKCPESTNCSSYSFCSDCIMDVACGWCSEVNLNLNLCMTKNEGETGLCNSHFFHHIWKKDTSLSKCPKISMNNFVNYIGNNLHDSNDFSFVNQPSTSQIKLPDKADLKSTFSQLKNTMNNKIKDQINVDRLLRNYNQTKTNVINLEKEIDDLDKEMNLNSTIKSQILIQKLKDIEMVIKIHLKLVKDGKANEINDMFQRDFDRYYRELNETRLNKDNSTDAMNNSTSEVVDGLKNDTSNKNSQFLKMSNESNNANESSIADSVEGNSCNQNKTTQSASVNVTGEQKTSSFLQIEEEGSDKTNGVNNAGLVQRILNLIDLI